MPVLYRSPDGTAFKTRQELDEQYDLALTIGVFSDCGDVGQYMDEFAERSVAARSQLDGRLGISYGPTLSETLDVFPGEPGGPVVVFIHGGSWMALTSAEHSFLAQGLVARGASVVIPTYALCPDVSMDEIVRQVRSAVAWTYRNIESFGGDRDQICVVGHSAGGHLAAMLALTEWEEDYDGLPAEVIRGACAISGIFDLRPIRFTSDQDVLALTADEVLRNSPLLLSPTAAPPLLLTYGERQPREYHRQTLEFGATLSRAGVDATCWMRPELNHFDELYALAEPESEITQRILDLTRGRLPVG